MAQSPLTLTCRSSPPEASLRWYFNGTRLDPASNSGETVGPDGTLTITNPNISYTGTYTCNVSTSFAVALAHIQVIVGGKCNMDQKKIANSHWTVMMIDELNMLMDMQLPLKEY